MLRAIRSGAHRHLGYASFAEYVERLFGYKRRATEEKLRVAQALESLPEMNRSLRDGELTWSAARELTRVATPSTENEWLGATQNKTVRQVERLVSARKIGNRPGDPVRLESRRHVLHFDVSAETFATFREAVAHLRRKSEQPLDDDSLLLLMAREILRGPSDEGRASYQLAITTCEHCAQGFQQGAGELLPVEPEIVEMARCDAQELGNLSETHGSARATQAVKGGLTLSTTWSRFALPTTARCTSVNSRSRAPPRQSSCSGTPTGRRTEPRRLLPEPRSPRRCSWSSPGKDSA